MVVKEVVKVVADFKVEEVIIEVLMRTKKAKGLDGQFNSEVVLSVPYKVKRKERHLYNDIMDIDEDLERKVCHEYLFNYKHNCSFDYLNW